MPQREELSPPSAGGCGWTSGGPARRRRARVLVTLCWLLLANGCARRAPVTFLITNADTGDPVPSAHVEAGTTTSNFNTDALSAAATGQLAAEDGYTDRRGLVRLD